MSVWYLIFLCGVLTFLIRFIPLSGLIRFKGSELYLKVINLIPIVVLTPIIVQALFFDKNDNGQKALDVAYTDIENAFDYFIKKYNKNNPFIIAGHSQGALHANRLINRRIDNREIQKRFICGLSLIHI